MKVKIFTATNGDDLEKAINEFISQADMTVINIKFSTSTKEFSALVSYTTVGMIE
jgi:hypothetical protein